MAAGLGPDTLLSRYLQDRRFLFVLPRAVCLQSLHPTIATGITQHALLHRRVWLHHKRTVTQAIRIAFTDVDMRPYIRFAHEEVKGRDPAGHKYHALNPDIFHFQHATYVESLVMMVNTFIRKLDDREHEQLYQECCSWYRRYGISTRPMPGSWTEFGEYFEDACRTQLSAGEHFEPFRRQMFAPTDWWPRAVPHRAIRAMQHPRAAELTGTEVSARDRRSLRRFTVAARVLS
ncbi:oxygenase MpaB family protein [Mycolicibacterium sp. 050232]|uniref:oxygenase MpaB family protein n=1 Tax=Mycolicibacterium sp. 050232 TaxID=3113982 RepID=UPI002E27EF58|nr:oxygenase MpaB family protein [Mycolicibacterium sp. 050232]MED5815179.1 oxygenase MpaB family protein [Mycolicibacterium sp. 050232]